MLVLDELSSFKNYRSKRFSALKKVISQFKRVIGLTGTPAPNSLEELWPQVFLLDKGARLGRTFHTYIDLYFCIPNSWQPYKHELKAGAEDAIYKKLSDICVSMKATDHLNMPERVENMVELTLSSREMKLYKQMERDMLLPYADGDILALNAATLAGKLLQLANGACYDEYHDVKVVHNQKLDALEDLIEAANGKPVLVAYWFKHDLERIKSRFKVREIKSSSDIREWNAGKIPVAVIHPASAGHGLNLQTGGSTLIWFGLTWSLELYQQTNARLWRQGQQDTVVIHHIITDDTVDGRVLKALQSKEKIQDSLIAAVKAELSK
jgi:SNF2 family DNA or RNA helicase